MIIDMVKFLDIQSILEGKKMPLNEGQLKAIQQRDASILVSAPAGSGKTKILVSRIVELLKEGYEIL
ncbi:MAG: UvrD-helicase domain-containing protein [Longibaculum sp.]